jgi:hypothetical protein
MKFLAPVLSISLVSSTNIQVPLTSDLRGHPLVEVDINGSDPSHHSLILSLGRLTRVHGEFTRTEPGWTISISNTTLSVVDPLVLFSSTGSDGRQGGIGIGPNSPLFRTYDSLAVPKNTSHPLQLVVRSTDENFATACVDGSLTRMRLDVFPDNRIRGIVQFASDRIPTTTGAVLIVDEAVSG